jgi:hypothetical protein
MGQLSKEKSIGQIHKSKNQQEFEKKWTALDIKKKTMAKSSTSTNQRLVK